MDIQRDRQAKRETYKDTYKRRNLSRCGQASRRWVDIDRHRNTDVDRETYRQA
jgi:hypothetical protein